jgi:rubredoxin
MRCLMCERMYSEENGDSAEGFCSESCRHVYEHLYNMSEMAASDRLKA